MFLKQFKYSQFLAVLFFILSILNTQAADSSQLIEQAKSIKLHESDYWHSLLHYDRTLSGYKSVVDDPKFFLSLTGKSNPLSELTATINAFSQGDPKEKKHPVNRFPARLTWLLEQLPEAKDVFVSQSSSEFLKVWESLDPNKIRLIFPAQYMNNPASLFGHTLLNIEGTRNKKLLAYSLNYAAVTTDTNGIVFAIKGILGSYKGFYSVDAYYKKVVEYSDINMRDIWEYDLNLNEKEIKRLIEHVWELQTLYSYYYFFDENCSYNLLFMLDVARPGLKLVEKFKKPWVLPSDTIKVISNSGLIEKTSFRASRAAKIEEISKVLSEDEKDLAIDLSFATETEKTLQAISVLERNAKIRIYDLSSELIAINLGKRKISQDVYRKVYLKLLSNRAKLGQVDKYEFETPLDPVDTHDSLRLTIGAGQYDENDYINLGFRGIYHGLEDPWQGYSQGSSIEAVNLNLYYLPEEGDFELRKFELVKINSLSPRDSFFQPKSWRVDLGVESFISGKDQDLHHSPYFNFGMGHSYRLNDKSIAYILANGATNLSSHLDDNHIIYLGLESGLLFYPNERSSAQLNVKQEWPISGQKDTISEATVRLNWQLSSNSNINGYFTIANSFDNHWTEGGFSLSFFF